MVGGGPSENELRCFSLNNLRHKSSSDTPAVPSTRGVEIANDSFVYAREQVGDDPQRKNQKMAHLRKNQSNFGYLLKPKKKD